MEHYQQTSIPNIFIYKNCYHFITTKAHIFLHLVWFQDAWKSYENQDSAPTRSSKLISLNVMYLIVHVQKKAKRRNVWLTKQYAWFYATTKHCFQSLQMTSEYGNIFPKKKNRIKFIKWYVTPQTCFACFLHCIFC